MRVAVVGASRLRFLKLVELMVVWLLLVFTPT